MKLTICGEAGIVDVVDMVAGDPVTSLIGVCAPVSGPHRSGRSEQRGTVEAIVDRFRK